MTESIRQNPRSLPLPDFRRPAVVLRLVLVVNLMVLLAALVRASEGQDFFAVWHGLAGQVEPPLMLSLFVLYVLAPGLSRLSLNGAVSIALAVCASSACVLQLWELPAPSARALWLGGFWAALIGATCLLYLIWRERAYLPALAEARLMALTARIRPHFLFNSLNGVLGVMRNDPRRAELALEEMADMFRALMRDNRDLVPLSDELALCRQYLNLEKLRLGERLRVSWDVADGLDDALVPPLMLQPLVENAVYHGIEPGTEPGEVAIRIALKGGGLDISISNPLQGEGRQVSGNRMALNNIRERLMLFYDLEARLATRLESGQYRVRLQLPHQPGGRP